MPFQAFSGPVHILQLNVRNAAPIGYVANTLTSMNPTETQNQPDSHETISLFDQKIKMPPEQKEHELNNS